VSDEVEKGRGGVPVLSKTPSPLLGTNKGTQQPDERQKSNTILTQQLEPKSELSRAREIPTSDQSLVQNLNFDFNDLEQIKCCRKSETVEDSSRTWMTLSAAVISVQRFIRPWALPTSGDPPPRAICTSAPGAPSEKACKRESNQ